MGRQNRIRKYRIDLGGTSVANTGQLSGSRSGSRGGLQSSVRNEDGYESDSSIQSRCSGSAMC